MSVPSAIQEQARLAPLLAKGVAWLHDRAMELAEAYEGGERKRIADQLRAFADRVETL
jgi:hypothetical protein